MTTLNTSIRDAWSDRITSTLRPEDPEWVVSAKREAAELIRSKGLPTRRDEDWRYTDPAPLLEADWRVGVDGPTPPPTEEDIRAFTYWDASAVRVVFLNGRYVPELSVHRTRTDGLSVVPLSEVMAGKHPSVESLVAQQLTADRPAMDLLATGGARDGLVLRLEDGVEVEGPIHVLCLTDASGDDAYIPLFHVFELGGASRLTLVERYANLASSPRSFTNSATDILLGPGACLDHYTLEREAERAIHLGARHVRQEDRSEFRQTTFTIGASLARHDTEVLCDGDETTTSLGALFLGEGTQHIDHRILVHHRGDQSRSEQLFKGILDEGSTGVFNGRVVVDEGTHGNDAQQSNHNLLLSDDATVNTRPQLEIYADDVSCSHGATVGQLDPDSLFYLRTRGIPRGQAESLLTYAFASDVVDRIRIDFIRERVQEFLSTRMEFGNTSEMTQ
ncbi:MAG TPA: Fe-S cluster assembly protein SufD [Planctomycetes bacterium]|nr:Fe-S cluster assembly protein SufD [Planctomycetota bacterium]